jgi:uncharacterized membrane protein
MNPRVWVVEPLPGIGILLYGFACGTLVRAKSPSV